MNHGIAVEVLLFCNPQDLRGDAAINLHVIRKSGTAVRDCESGLTNDELTALLDGADWIVDALLGTGARGSIREPFATVIHGINCVSAKVFAVDLPSGMDCDTGVPLPAAEPAGSKQLPCCVRARHTATLVARKIGFDIGGVEEFTGTIHIIDIGIPRSLLEAGQR